jgi:hypothetical protein
MARERCPIDNNNTPHLLINLADIGTRLDQRFKYRLVSCTSYNTKPKIVEWVQRRCQKLYIENLGKTVTECNNQME